MMGSAGERACRAITLLQLVMLNADYLLVNTVSLAAVVPAATLCRPTCVRLAVLTERPPRRTERSG